MSNRPNRPPAALPLGRETLSWVRLGGEPTRGKWPLKLLLRWQSFWFERNLALQRLMPTERSVKPDPVLILGLWRTGTTYLHDLLGACPGMLSPTTSQCLNPESFRLRAPPGGGRSAKRPMDGLTIDTLSPQEDEFALLALGVPSVYRGFIDPRRLPELGKWLEPGNWSAAKPEGWAATWREFLADVGDRQTGRLVLKSPGHSFRIDALPEIFPNSAYVWLVRDPIDTFLSNRKMWNAMFDRYALWDPEPSVLDSFLIKALECAAECLQRATDHLPKNRLVVVHFGQLTGSTLDSLELLSRRLSLGCWGEMQPSLARTVASRAAYRPDSYSREAAPGAIAKAAERLNSVQLAAMASHGIRA